MPRYESAGYDPPAPVAEVGLRQAGDPGPPPVTHCAPADAIRLWSADG